MRILSAILVLLTASNIAFSQSFNPAITVLSSNEQALILAIKPVLKSVDTLRINGQNYVNPQFSVSTDLHSISGAPANFVIAIPITVPNETGASIESIKVNSGKSISLPIVPIPSQQFINERHTPFYEPKEELYAQSSPKSWASLQYKGLARDRHIAHLDVVVAQWNATLQKTEIAEDIVVTIRFVPTSSTTSSQKQPKTSSFDVTINGSSVPNFLVQEPTKHVSAKKSEQRFSSGRWCSFDIPSEGIYRLTPSMLSSAGISITPAEISSIKIYGNGGAILPESQTAGRNNQLIEQPIIVNTTSSGELESIVLYACGPIAFVDTTINNRKTIARVHNTYIRNGRYLLSVGTEGNGLRTSPIPPTTEPVVSQPMKYTHRYVFEEELRNAYQISTGRRWFGRNVDGAFPQTFPMNLPNLVRNDTILYVAEVGHTMSSSATMQLSDNGKTIATANLSSINPKNYEDHFLQRVSGFLPSNDIAQDQRSILRFSYNGTGNGFLDFFEIHYPRECFALNNEIDFFTSFTDKGSTEYAFSGFTGKVYGFDVTDRARPQEVANASSIGGMFTIRQSYELGKVRKYFISSSLKEPINVSSIQTPYLRSKMLNADVVVICHSSMTSSAEQYKLHHKNSGKTIEIVTQEQIMNEFSYGQVDPTAIRDFLAFAYQNWTTKPTQVVLWGTGHYDYRNITTSTPILVPTWMAYISQNSSYIPFDRLGTNGVVDATQTDDYYVRILGVDTDNVPDIGVARLPFRSNSEALVYISKLEDYRNNQSQDIWRASTIMIADDGATSETTGEGSLHTGQSENLIHKNIPNFMQSKKIYLVDYPNVFVGTRIRIPEANEAILQAVNETGGVLLNFTGHGSPRVWAHEEVFDRDKSIPLMTNKDKLFFMTGATCDFSRFDEFSVRSGAEELAFSSFGGAIGVMSASRVVLSQANAALNDEFYRQIFRKKSNGTYPTIGEAFYAMKQVRTQTNDDKFYLLADPLVTLHIPNQNVVIEEINTIPTVDSTVPILSLSTVTLKGKIQNIDSTYNSSFNGLVNIAMFSAPFNDNFRDRYSNNFSVIRSGSILHKGAYTVENGNFTARFVIPKVTTFSLDPGQLYLYGFSQQNDYAVGFSNKFVVSGISTEEFDDVEGPKIDLYLDGRLFQPYDIVRPIPTLIVDLSDETGVNATGEGIGNKIQVWVNNNPKPIDITSTFRTSITAAGTGTATTALFGLNPGTHSVRVRAWDVLNNFSENETFFQTLASTSTYISECLTFPNPVVDYGLTYFRFKHTLSSAFTAKVAIYTSDGTLVKNIEQVITTLQTGEIQWDRTDLAGLALAQGAYYYTISIQPFGSTEDFESMGTFIYSK